MNDEIKKCVDARVNFFDEYYIVPADIEGEVTAFITDTKKLGDSCNDATEFEEKFVSTGLSEIFNTILPKCTPKPVKMTKEQKKQSVKITAGIIKDNKKEIISDSVNRAGQRVFNDIKDDAIDKNRKRMIENDTFDDYSRTTNSVSNAGFLFGFFKKIFKKNSNMK